MLVGRYLLLLWYVHVHALECNIFLIKFAFYVLRLLNKDGLYYKHEWFTGYGASLILYKPVCAVPCRYTYVVNNQLKIEGFNENLLPAKIARLEIKMEIAV